VVGYDGDGTDTLATLIYSSSTGVRMDPETGSTTFTIHAIAVHNNGLYEDSEIYRFDYELLQLGRSPRRRPPPRRNRRRSSAAIRSF
jgi:hypothetical protein